MRTLLRKPDRPRVEADDTSKAVTTERYIQLITSRRRLERCDGPGGLVRGLVDLDTGRRYTISKEQLGLVNR
ncbi:MAG: hypothetical protein AB7O38_16850 [Pirellulaceae bacterium]